VSVPLPGLQARFIQEIDTPEGKRAAVLFSFVEGESIRRPSIGQCKVAGEALGAIHEKLSDFAPGPMSWDYQPEKLFAYVRTSVDGSLRNFPDDLHYLTRLQEAVSEKLKGVSLQSGICHGDLQSENFYFLKDGSVSFIDFDFSGYGPLLYDLGAYTWYDHQGKTKEMLHSFYDGYSRHVALNVQEIELIPLFGALRAVFLMGMWNSFMDGESNPIWPADQVSAFVKKLKKWLEKECKMKI
jgi:Ser/Thr protein kinase RdoA (MazF antagonist)